jgi:SAM-dependent methyltransferase
VFTAQYTGRDLLSRLNARLLYGLAKLLYRSDVGHSDEMKHAMEDRAAWSSYRSAEFTRILEAAERYHIDLKGQRVVDFGCNDGSISRRYLDAGAADVIGVDIDAPTIDRANRLHSGPHVRFVRGTVRTIPIEDASVDVIISYDVFEHVADPPATVAECHRILKPGGKMLIGTWGWYHPFAPHLWAVMPVPWAHVVYSEKTILRAARLVYMAPWYRPTMHDFDAQGRRLEAKYLGEEKISTDFLNKYFVSDFERVFRASPFQTEFHLVPFGSKWARWSHVLLPVPYVREFVTGYLWIVCTRPGRDPR